MNVVRIINMYLKTNYDMRYDMYDKKLIIYGPIKVVDFVRIRQLTKYLSAKIDKLEVITRGY